MAQNLDPDFEDPRIRRALELMLETRAAASMNGDPPVGWKIAINDPSTQARLGLSGPLLGFLTAARVFPSETIALPAGGVLLVEAEMALRLRKEVSTGAGLMECQNAIGAIAPALEVLAIDGPLHDLELMAQKNIYHAGVRFGPWQPLPAGFTSAQLEVELRRDGDVVAGLNPQLVVGDPGEIVFFVNRALARFGERLRADEYIICGSLNPPSFIRHGSRIDATIRPLGSVALAIPSIRL